MKKKKIVLMFTMIFLFYSFNLLYARDFHVTNGNGFQEALTQAAANGQDDTIFMAAGIYQRISGTGVHYANFEYLSSGEDYSITIIGEPGTSSSDIIIDAHNSGFCLYMICSGLGGDFDNDAYVSGITFRDGNSSVHSSGLEIWGQYFSVTVTKCEIINNTSYESMSYYGGGGLHIIAAHVYIENNKILYNTCYDLRDDDGDVFNVNGGGVYFHAFRTSYLRNNIIAYNYSISETGEALCYGGGIYISFLNAFNESLSLINNTIYGNIAGMGGGIYINGAAGPRVNLYNNIVYNNTAYSSGGGNDIYSISDTVYPYTPIKIYSHNNNYSDFVYETTEESINNLNLNPAFVNAGAGNFHLSLWSPMISAGTNIVPTPPGLPDFDFEGDERLYGTMVDIGADEQKSVFYAELPFKARIIVMNIVGPEIFIKDIEVLKMKGLVYNPSFNDKGEIWIVQVSKSGIKYFTKNNGWTNNISLYYQGIIDKKTEIEINKFVILTPGLYDYYIIVDKKDDGKINADCIIGFQPLLVIDDKQ